MKLLDLINSPKDLKALPQEKLPKLAQEIRDYIIGAVSKTGGHLAPSLGVVELTIALHYLLNAPEDTIFWDVGHQSYTHKILTGRKDRFSTLRQFEGLSGFPNRYESKYDPVTCGHSSTSISFALGVASARDLGLEKKKVAVVIGDAALAGGMAFEALNHAGEAKKNMIVILNDNKMSISAPRGAMAKYLNRILTTPIYNRIRKDMESLVKKIPKYGKHVYGAARKLEESLKNLLIPGIIFEELGFRYFGPIDGHNIDLLISTIKNVKDLDEPILLHVLTKKGKGYKFAEDSPGKFHGISPFYVNSGRKKSSGPSFTQALGEKLVELGRLDPKVVAITAAMPEGTGLDKFAKEFPNRFFDVGIAEQHAVCFSAGLAQGGFKPVTAIYSTFLQRAYDQIIHDVCLQNLHVVFAIDRAGLVGEDGPTHHGPLDLSYLCHLPNMTVMAPKDQAELGQMLEFAVNFNGPIALRYPRGGVGPNLKLPAANPIELGKAEILRQGKDMYILAIGSMVYPSLEAAENLSKDKIEATVINARFSKPLDKELFETVFAVKKPFLIVEEGVLTGGFGSLILDFVDREGLNSVKLKRMGLPPVFIEHGTRNLLLEKYGLDAKAITEAAISLCQK